MTIDSMFIKKMTSICEIIFKRCGTSHFEFRLIMSKRHVKSYAKRYARPYARNSARLAGLALKQPPSAVVCVLDEVSIMPRDFTQ